jgi:quinol monooxygenase YgiN
VNTGALQYGGRSGPIQSLNERSRQMSLLVRYTLKDAADHAKQIKAMQQLVAGLKQEAIPGLTYSCFETEVATEFVGVLEFPDEATFKAFQASKAFAAYRETVGPTFANPPQTQKLTAIASTRV